MSKSRLFVSILVALIISTLSSCTWVNLTTAGEQVEVRTANQLAGCERLGRASSTTMERLLLVIRSDNLMQRELFALARNEAANIGGNAIVATTGINSGNQQFEVYRCP
ncbi:MAG: DUF4156 domain-containing protein [Gammaproteobacteria bacterium]|nr:DUF4156 domain-containing protein [Gammaproteobacteria bacterium]